MALGERTTSVLSGLSMFIISLAAKTCWLCHCAIVTFSNWIRDTNKQMSLVNIYRCASFSEKYFTSEMWAFLSQYATEKQCTWPDNSTAYKEKKTLVLYGTQHRQVPGRFYPGSLAHDSSTWSSSDRTGILAFKMTWQNNKQAKKSHKWILTDKRKFYMETGICLSP